MQEVIIDFQKYSSLKIGSKIHVKILEVMDFNGHFVQYDKGLGNDISYQKEQDFHTSCSHRENNNSHITSIPSHSKPIIFYNQTIHFPHIVESLETSHVCCDAQQLRIIGRANNLLVSPNAKNLALFGESLNYISILPDCIEMGASVTSLQAFLFFKQHNIMGLEFLKNLPGNIGALCNMNAGMKEYEMKQSIQSININGVWVDIEKAGLHYRGRDSNGVIFAVRFHKKIGFRDELLKVFSQMRKNHPKNPSCGSCFKNPPNDYAGRLLEKVGMKGYSRNGVGFSKEHANFLVNLNHASFDDALYVIHIAKKKVYEECGIQLECEVKICD